MHAFALLCLGRSKKIGGQVNHSNFKKGVFYGYSIMVVKTPGGSSSQNCKMTLPSYNSAQKCIYLIRRRKYCDTH